ncbi:MAG TPA: hypothetical protein VGY91_10125 [Chthoniobacterales bacterium]|nr:hypothetical protein [Chthoniobacterales bacterium]
MSAEVGGVYKGILRRQTDARDSVGLGFAYSEISRNVPRPRPLPYLRRAVEDEELD